MSSVFFTLPVELRERIYLLVVTPKIDDNPIIIRSASEAYNKGRFPDVNKDPMTGEPAKRQEMHIRYDLALFRTNTQISDEATRVFLEQNTFVRVTLPKPFPLTFPGTFRSVLWGPEAKSFRMWSLQVTVRSNMKGHRLFPKEYRHHVIRAEDLPRFITACEYGDNASEPSYLGQCRILGYYDSRDSHRPNVADDTIELTLRDPRHRRHRPHNAPAPHLSAKTQRALLLPFGNLRPLRGGREGFTSIEVSGKVPLLEPVVNEMHALRATPFNTPRRLEEAAQLMRSGFARLDCHDAVGALETFMEAYIAMDILVRGPILEATKVELMRGYLYRCMIGSTIMKKDTSSSQEAVLRPSGEVLSDERCPFTDSTDGIYHDSEGRWNHAAWQRLALCRTMTAGTIRASQMTGNMEAAFTLGVAFIESMRAKLRALDEHHSNWWRFRGGWRDEIIMPSTYFDDSQNRAKWRGSYHLLLEPAEEACLEMPGADAVGEIYYRVGVMLRSRGYMDLSASLLRVAAVYLPMAALVEIGRDVMISSMPGAQPEDAFLAEVVKAQFAEAQTDGDAWDEEATMVAGRCGHCSECWMELYDRF